MIQVLVSNPVPGKPEFEELLDQLTAPVYDVPNLSRQGLPSRSLLPPVSLQQLVETWKRRDPWRRNWRINCRMKRQPMQSVCSVFMRWVNLGAVVPKSTKIAVLNLNQKAIPASTRAQSSRISEIWPVLVDHADGNEEGTRNVVAECLGKLSVIDPHGLLPELKSLVTSPSARVRSAAVTAVKFMISDEKRPVDAVLQQCIGEFLQTMTDSDLNVRRVALIRNLLDVLLPSVYSETQVRKELIREVEMGPFKHQVDDGLDLRKSAFECMYTLLESCLEKLEIFEFINYVENGLRDMHHDIRLLSYLMLMKLAILCPNQLVQRLDKICESLKTQLQTKPKSNAVKQEIDKQDELKRAVIRVVLALQKIPDAERHQQLVDVAAMMRASPELRALTEVVQRDALRTFAVGDVPMDTI
ncbi:HEAT repeat protein [Cooperia oncophora]